MTRRRTEFHPSLEKAGLVPDSLREFAAQTASRFEHATDIPNPDLKTYEDPASGSRFRYYVMHPEKDRSLRRADETAEGDVLFLPHPFAHGLGNAQVLLTTAQTVANYLDMPVVGLPNNSGTEPNEWLSIETRKRAWKIGVQAIAEMRSGLATELVQEFAPEGRAHFMSWSEGGAAAVALGREVRDDIPIGCIGAYDVPNVKDRRFVRLARDFFGDDHGESRTELIRRTGIEAFQELESDRTKYILGMFGVTVGAKYLINMRPMTFQTNLVRARAFGHGTLRSNMHDILDAQGSSVADMVVASESKICPMLDWQDTVSSLRASYPDRVLSEVLDGSGHAEGNDTFAITALVGRSVNYARDHATSASYTGTDG